MWLFDTFVLIKAQTMRTLTALLPWSVAYQSGNCGRYIARSAASNSFQQLCEQSQEQPWADFQRFVIDFVIHLRFGAVGSDVGRINEVTLRRARLVLGWVTVSGFNSRCGKFSQFNQPPRSTQPGHPFVGRHNENRSKNGDALRLGSKSRYGVVCR